MLLFQNWNSAPSSSTHMTSAQRTTYHIPSSPWSWIHWLFLISLFGRQSSSLWQLPTEEEWQNCETHHDSYHHHSWPDSMCIIDVSFPGTWFDTSLLMTWPNVIHRSWPDCGVNFDTMFSKEVRWTLHARTPDGSILWQQSSYATIIVFHLCGIEASTETP